MKPGAKSGREMGDAACPNRLSHTKNRRDANRDAKGDGCTRGTGDKKEKQGGKEKGFRRRAERSSCRKEEIKAA